MRNSVKTKQKKRCRVTEEDTQCPPLDLLPIHHLCITQFEKNIPIDHESR